MNRITLELEQQLMIDYDCSMEEIHDTKNIVKSMQHNKKQRPIGDESSWLKLAVYNEKIFCMAHPKLLECMETMLKNRRGTWLSMPKNIFMIQNELEKYNQVLCDTHHHYLPVETFESKTCPYDLKWYEKDEIEMFRGDERFDEALLFQEETPDMLAVCAVKDEIILGMAAVTRDCENLWQIGVNVTKEGKGKGLGTYLTCALKEEVLKRGKIPTYATVESHIKSQQVAFRSGFIPAFYEMFSTCKKVKNIPKIR